MATVLSLVTKVESGEFNRRGVPLLEPDIEISLQEEVWRGLGPAAPAAPAGPVEVVVLFCLSCQEGRN